MSQRMSLDEHKAVAVHLKQARDCLVRAGVAVGNAYGERDMRAIARATALIAQARSRMEARLFVEYPSEATPQIYYPVTSPADCRGARND